jgi:filamentous hemagglutinin family protein
MLRRVASGIGSKSRWRAQQDETRRLRTCPQKLEAAMNADYGARKFGRFMGFEVARLKGSKSTKLHGSSVGRRTSMAPKLSSWRVLWVLSFILGPLPLLWVPISEGQTTSITSSGLGTTISPASIDPAGRPNYIITGGTRPGDGPNLFHSFGDFSVGTNNVARFFNETGRATTNILSRVTGGQTSNIYGTIQTAGFGTAALWLINPAGIVFGPSASLNVGGSVHFSTADYLRLGSGNDRFYADLGKTSQLTSAAVTAFGFLGERPAGPITVQGGTPLTVSEGSAISLIGGDVSITGRTISSPGGLLSVVSAGGTNVPPVSAEISPSPTFRPTAVESQGRVTLENATLNSSSSASFSGAGTILISGGKLVLNQTSFIANSHGANPGDEVVGRVIPTSGDVKVYADDATIQGSTFRTGVTGFTANNNISKFGGIVSGNIEFQVGTLNASDTTMGTTPTADKASVGSININGRGLVTLRDSQLNTDANTRFSTTDSGSITILADDIQLLTGPGSSVGTTLSAKSFALFDPVTAGSLLFEAGKTITTRGANIQTVVGSGEGGDIIFKAGNSINLLDNSTILAGSKSFGSGGNVSATAPVIHIQGSAVSAEGGATFSSLTDASGGNLTLTAKNLVYLQDSRIATSAIGGAGKGGNITIDPDAVVVQNSQILAQAIQGPGGAITITAGILLVDTASVIRADSQNQSLNGTINIQAPIQQLSGAIAPLPQAFAVATNLYGQRCAAEKGGQFSSFVQGARDGVPPQPGDLIPSPLMLELDEAPLSGGSQSIPSLAAIRLGLPEFEQSSRNSLTVFAGCRS